MTAECLHLNIVIDDKIKNYGDSFVFTMRCTNCDAWKSIELYPRFNRPVSEWSASGVTNK